MRRWLMPLAAAALLAAAGCGSDQDKGIYSSRDKPVAAPREAGDRDTKPAADSGRATGAEKPPADTARETKR
jgi:hypothetical protein